MHFQADMRLVFSLALLAAAAGTSACGGGGGRQRDGDVGADVDGDADGDTDGELDRDGDVVVDGEPDAAIDGDAPDPEDVPDCGDGVLDDGEKPPVREGAALQAPLTLYGSEGFETLVAFDREGRLTGAGGYFVLCEGDELKQDGHWRSRAVLVNGTGRVRMAARDDGRGVLLTDSGEIGDCGRP